MPDEEADGLNEVEHGQAGVIGERVETADEVERNEDEVEIVAERLGIVERAAGGDARAGEQPFRFAEEEGDEGRGDEQGSDGSDAVTSDQLSVASYQ